MTEHKFALLESHVGIPQHLGIGPFQPPRVVFHINKHEHFTYKLSFALRPGLTSQTEGEGLRYGAFLHPGDQNCLDGLNNR
jgi:hypothetical protein